MIIAIDGPAGSGKSTISKEISEELGITYLDTGAMYRLFTLKVLKEGVSFNESEKIRELLENLNINIENDRFYLDGEDVTEKIRTYQVSDNVSKIAALKEVREKMVLLQREFSKSKDVILDGRDIGTVVFPDADIKIFLVADPMERAKRRYRELKKKGEDVSLDEIFKNIMERDKIDSNRDTAPLRKAADAVEIDTTKMNIKDVKKEILTVYKNKKIFWSKSKKYKKLIKIIVII